MLTRTLQSIFEKALTETPKSLVLMGPRQTGKSTMLRCLSPHLTIDLADESTFQDHVKDPSLLRALCKTLPENARVLVDEVQRVPSLLNTIQSILDSKQILRFLLTGSSARKLRRGHANLLPGRTFWYAMHPLTYWELRDRWNLVQALTTGTLPEVYLTEYGPDLLGHYIATYLREEILAESLTRNIGAYARFLDVAAENSGRITNYSQLASDTEIPKETLRRFYDILFDTLIVHRLPGYSDLKSKRKASQKEVFLFFDMGVRNAVLRQHKNVFTATELGRLFEQWLINQIIAYNNYHQKDWSLFFYRDDQKNEVDLVVDVGPHVIAVEIKYSASFKDDYVEGLNHFAEVCRKPCQRILVYRGDHVQQRDDVKVIPYETFLNETVPSFGQ